MRIELQSLTVEPLAVPLTDPFVIASGRVEATRNVLVRATVRDERGCALGLGEGGCLPPVTKEDQADALGAIERAAPALRGVTMELVEVPAVGAQGKAIRLAELATQLRMLLERELPDSPVAASAVEVALLDGIARLRGVPLYKLLGGPLVMAGRIETDITVPLLAPARMAALAREWWAKGFRVFKVKVGRALKEDLAALQALREAVPEAVFRLDANGGYDAASALGLLRQCTRLGVRVECFEQPCAADDLEGMAKVTAAAAIPVVADESVSSLDALARLHALGAASGVNLKIAKTGSMVGALAIGREAKRLGLTVMVGGMVETRLGMTTAAHLVAALGGVDFPDLDTAWLLCEDRFEGGYRESGPSYVLDEVPGLGVLTRF